MGNRDQEERNDGVAVEPRVEVDSYVVYPTGYDGLPMIDADMFCLTIQNGHAWGWSIRRGIGMSSSMALNRKGQWTQERRGHEGNKRRRYSLEEATALAVKWVDRLTVNGLTAQQWAKHFEQRSA